jgi:hypothetical protein
LHLITSTNLKILFMKRVVILSMTFLFAASVTMAQARNTPQAKVQETKKEIKTERKALRKLEGTQVSELSQRNFAADFGKVTGVVWKRSDYFDEASFTQNGKQMIAFYDGTGTLVGTTSHTTFAALPAKVQKEITTKYKDYTVGAVVFFDDNQANDTDMYIYGTQLDDEDNYFVEMSKGTNKIVLRVASDGVVSFFKQLS